MNATDAWLSTLKHVWENGEYESTRNGDAQVARRHLLVYDAQQPVVLSSFRNLNYNFMVREAYWTCAGRNDVESMPEFMGQYSDNEHAFMGAYGPHIMQQWRWLTNLLIKSPETRQAVVTIWQPRPANSLDIPCTISMQFEIVNDKLETTVNMRSSDVWVGLPYDMFNFSCIATMLAIKLRQEGYSNLTTGEVGIFAGNRHLYTTHDGDINNQMYDCDEFTSPDRLTPDLFSSPGEFIHWLDYKANEEVGRREPWKIVLE